MKNTKLVEILRTFSKQEIKNFGKFVASPFFSRGRDLKPFYKIIKSFHPGFDSPDLNNEKIFKILYHEEKYNKSKAENVIRVLSSELAKLAEEYLTYIVFKVHKLKNRNSLLDILISKNLNKLYRKLHDETEKELVMPNLYSPQHFLDIFFFKILDVIQALHINKRLDSTLDSQVYLMNHFFLSSAYFIETSYKKQITHNLNHKDGLFKYFVSCLDVKRFITYFNKLEEIKKVDKDILELCFYFLMSILEKDNDSYLSKVEKNFYNVKHLFTRTEKIRFYFMLLDAYAARNNLKKANKLFKDILADNIFDHEQGKEMPFTVFRRILHNFTELRKLKDAENFVLKYSKFLNTDRKQSFYNFGFALIEFKRKHFDKALEYISKVEMLVFFLKYDLKILYMKIYYELNYTEEALSIIDSYKHFLKINKNVSDSEREKNSKFVDHYKKLLSAKISGKMSDLPKLKIIINGDDNLIYKDWLLEKIEEFL